MNPDERQPSPRSHRTTDVVLGFFLCLGLHLLHLLYIPAVIVIGLTQWLYVIPMLIVFRRRKGVMQGLLIAAALTFLLNAACFGIVLSNL
ncbi:hypothetical protein GE107_22625 [Cohnella sp. CFH 77786]|uniref:hypothetical protein n=1 Tax=Cohnella sp. CFH 77786 TaxID=2662265 RepID=UPI001C60DF1B|nr:hypothetical protein [Cohnella sp. CFH 77786]MBW5448840.1 hypothetical protein [Cohnella sp. CFH 77786]